MNIIYKTNKYKLLLLIITGVITLNILFYVIFAFIFSEYIFDYK